MAGEELRSFRIIQNPDGTISVEELTDGWHPVVTVSGPAMASDAELAAAIAVHAALSDVHHPSNAGITGTKTLGGFKFTFTNGLLTGFEPV